MDPRVKKPRRGLCLVPLALQIFLGVRVLQAAS